MPSLIERLDCDDAYVAAEAVTALAKIGTPDAICAVRNARKHRFAVVRRTADTVLKGFETSQKGRLVGS